MANGENAWRVGEGGQVAQALRPHCELALVSEAALKTAADNTTRSLVAADVGLSGAVQFQRELSAPAVTHSDWLLVDVSSPSAGAGLVGAHATPWSPSNSLIVAAIIEDGLQLDTPAPLRHVVLAERVTGPTSYACTCSMLVNTVQTGRSCPRHAVDLMAGRSWGAVRHGLSSGVLRGSRARPGCR
jgi:hypothetical protein